MSSKRKKKAPGKPGRPLRQSPPPTAKRVRSLSDLAGLLGVSYETCRKAQQDGDLIVATDGSIDVEQARVAMAERAMRGKSGSVLGGATSESKHWDTELKKAKAIKEQLAVKQRLGELVEKSEVIRAQIQRELAFKNAVMGIGRIVAPQLVNRRNPLEIEEIISRYVNEALTHLATGGANQQVSA